MLKPLQIFILSTLLVSVPTSAYPANSDDAAARAQAKLQGMLRELSVERDRLKQQVNSLTGENQQLKTELAAQKQSAETASRLSGEVAALKSGQQRLSDQYQQASSRLHDVSDKYKSLQQDQQRLTGELAQSQQQQLTVAGELQQCMEKNLGLLKVTRDLVNNMGERSTFDNLLAQEPLLGLNGVELENRIQAYQDRLNAHQYKPSQPSVDAANRHGSEPQN